jgi:hypothetical protein
LRLAPAGRGLRPFRADARSRGEAAAFRTLAIPGASSPPAARTVAQVDTIFGIELSDPYRWMEGAQNAEFDAWLRGEGAYRA